MTRTQAFGWAMLAISLVLLHRTGLWAHHAMATLWCGYIESIARRVEREPLTTPQRERARQIDEGR